MWTRPYDKTLLITKDEYIYIIISDFKSREFGFGFAWDDISDADLKRINYFKAEKSYMDKDATSLLQNWSALKKDMSR